MNHSEPSNRNKVGRKSTYRQEYCEQLIEHCSQGLSVSTFGGVIGVCTSVIYDWERIYPEFAEAKNIARNRHRLFYEKCIADSCAGKKPAEGTMFHDTKSAMWLLERTQRKSYGKEPNVTNNNIQLNKHETRNVIDIRTLSLDAQKKLARELIKNKELTNGE